VGYLNVENSYYTGEKVLRLYLLADWLETREATAVRDTQLSESTERWIIERVRWYRLRRRLMDQYEIGETTAQAQLESHRASLTCRYEQAREAVGLLLNMLGFNAEITTEDRAFYDKAMLSASATNPGHAFKNILDFTGMP
jgi:hypothetical protein